MTEIKNSKIYDLEERTASFAEQCRDFIKSLPKTIHNIEYSKQLVRSSGSQAANYIEANESLSKKDFIHRVKICRKETKESCLWLRLCDINKDGNLDKMRLGLTKEGHEFRNIFTAILNKSLPPKV